MENVSQMTILDVIGDSTQMSESQSCDLDTLPEIKMVEMISSATGLMFLYNQEWERYESRISKNEIYRVSYRNYAESVKDGARFISCGHEYRNGGSGSPCDSLEQAIDFFNRELRKEVN